MVIVNAALEFIERQQKVGKPTLSVIWFGSPHTPHRASAEDLAEYSEVELDEKRKHYVAEITGVDRAMGVLRTRLRELEIADKTIVWFSAIMVPIVEAPPAACEDTSDYFTKVASECRVFWNGPLELRRR